ncbi:MAG: septal ring lytic transglycosylase RlpA family protein [Rhodospirillaceae bacterium]|nr:septal ring lytic transglycosylase RlpA family protein [Rhodospirillaceae bacterium]
MARSLSRWALIVVAGVFVSACAETQFLAYTVKKAGKEDKAASGGYKIGKPYQIQDVWYYPSENFEYDETGIASWYGDKFHGRKTANGEIFDMNEISAAHRTLPMPSFVRVTNLENGRSLNVRVNDRGPFAHGRIIDMSRRASQLLGFQRNGTARVRVSILADESRALASRLKGETGGAEVDTPITVDSLPKATVSSENLAPPGAEPGVASAPPPAVEKQPVAIRKTALLPEAGVVSIEPVSETQIFIQIGAFSNFDNANRVHARLIKLGPIRISPVLINGRDLFRVRVGPMSSVVEADRMLETIFKAGYTDARTIIDK